jgi:hypothetical protein
VKDGLYIVDHGSMCAAFVVEKGKVTICAPILRKNLDYWKKIAKWYPTAKNPLDEISGKGVEKVSMT